MDIGRLNKRVTIQRFIETKDPITHITKQQWRDLKTVKCSMNNLHGKEYWTAKEYGAENTLEFVMRYSACQDLSVKDRLKIGEKFYDIKSIDNVMYTDKVLKVKALELIK